MSTTSPSTPVWSESATIYAAIELSSTSWLLAIEAPDRKKLSRHQVPAGDCARLIGYLEQARARVHEQTDAPVDVITCYEAGRDGFWLHRVLQARGIHNQVVDAASLLTDRKKKSAKTDKIDVRKILRALKLWHEGDREACRMVHVPTPDQEDERRPVREAQRLKKEQTAHLTRVASLTAQHGIRTFQPLRRDWRGQLERLQTADGRPLTLERHARVSTRRSPANVSAAIRPRNPVSSTRRRHAAWRGDAGCRCPAARGRHAPTKYILSSNRADR